MDVVPVTRALISVSDKTGIVEFCTFLASQGVQLLSTGGTAAKLRDSGLEVMDVSAYTGAPECLDGRVKTLHPKVHGGLLGVRGNAKHEEQMKENGIEKIDMTVLNLYPFAETIAKPGCTFETAVENIDIGGPSMLRSTAKVSWRSACFFFFSKRFSEVFRSSRSKCNSEPLSRPIPLRCFFCFFLSFT